MNIKFLETSLGTNKLRDYLIKQIKDSKSEAEREVDDIIDQILKKIEIDSLKDEDKPSIIATELIILQKIIYQKEISTISFFVNTYKNYKTSLLNNINDNSENDKLADFIFEYYKFIDKPDWIVFAELKRIKDDFKKYFLSHFNEKKSERLFQKLNEMNYPEKYEWNISNFEHGVIEIYKKIFLENKQSNDNFNTELEIIKQKNELEVDKLNYQINSLKMEKMTLEGVIQFQEDYRKKYLDDVQVKVYNTYFGDNLPFLKNLYNFLCEHLLLKMCSFSHFYLCMTVKNNEILNLNNEINSRFIGRIFYNLSKLSILKTKKLFDEFIRNKFYINERPLVPSFFTNNVFVTIDTQLHPEILIVDEFFENQKQIFNKHHKKI